MHQGYDEKETTAQRRTVQYMRLRSLVAAALTILATVAPALPAQSQTVGATVDMVGYQFVPAVTVVAAGQSIVWRNAEPLPILHNVVLATENTAVGSRRIVEPVAPGSSSGPVTLPAGTYTYTCTVDIEHVVLMHGVIVVR